MNDLARIRKKYNLPGMFSMAVLEAFTNACIHELGFITLYEDTLATGLRLPLYPLARDLLCYLEIYPSQFAPNG